MVANYFKQLLNIFCMLKYVIFMVTNSVQVNVSIIKIIFNLLHLAEPVVINLTYIASNTSLMMSLSVKYYIAVGYLDGKFTICFSPTV